jgi:hypothetical protein
MLTTATWTNVSMVNTMRVATPHPRRRAEIQVTRYAPLLRPIVSYVDMARGISLRWSLGSYDTALTSSNLKSASHSSKKFKSSFPNIALREYG